MERPGLLIRRFGARLGSGANRIALSGAVRTMIAVGVPFVALPLAGLAAFSHVAALSALGITNVDVGGPYRARLAAMALAAVGAPLLLALGATVEDDWLLAAAVMAAVAMASGMIRAVGPGGISLGISFSFAFLIGIAFGPEAGDRVHHYALAYLGGGAWTIALTVAFWQLRPYRRFEQEAAIAWEAVADLVDAALRPAEGGLGRRRHERDLDLRHAAARRAIEQGRAAIGRLRDAIAGPGTTIGQLVVLLTAAARVEAAAVALSESAVADPVASRALETACRAVARALLTGRGTVALGELRALVRGTEAAGRPGAQAMAQALRNLEAADEALQALTAHRHSLGALIAMPFATRGGVPVLAALQPHLTLRSAILRHALRVAVVTAAGTALTVRLGLPHGVWLPMTALLVLQPGFGDTLRRAGERSAGTLAGALGAGVLLVAVRGTAMLDIVIPLLAGATAFFRRRYMAHATAFQTPLIMLLLGYGTASGWTDIAERIVYTGVGAAAAVAAVFALWPQREREALERVLARAVGAAATYVDAVLAGDVARLLPSAYAVTPRRAAETELANADLAFQRLAGEPTHRRGAIAGSFMLTVHLHRLIRQAITIEAHLAALPRDEPALAALRSLVVGALRDAAAALEEGRAPAPRPPFDESLAALGSRLAAAAAPAAVTAALGKLVSATTALNAAAAPA